MTERLVTARAVAEHIGFSTAAVLDRWEGGELPGFKIGRAVRFRLSEIDAWLEEECRRGPCVSERDASLSPSKSPVEGP